MPLTLTRPRLDAPADAHERAGDAGRCEARHDRIRNLIKDPAELNIVFQPVFDLGTQQLVALEALARFRSAPDGPRQVFAAAHGLGMGSALEMATARAAFAHLDRLPIHVPLSVNLAPSTLNHPGFLALLETLPAGRINVEVPQHSMGRDRSLVLAARRRLCDAGATLAIDDVTSVDGLAQELVVCDPHAIKIDLRMVRTLAGDTGKRSAVEAIVSFARNAGVNIVAEGIETRDELALLLELGVTVGQGFYLGRPGVLRTVLSEARPII